MKAKYNGRYIQVDKLKRRDVLAKGKIISRVIYTDDDGHCFIRHRDGSLALLRLICDDEDRIYHCCYELA